MYLTIQDFENYIKVNGVSPLTKETESLLTCLEKSLNVESIELSILQYQQEKAHEKVALKSQSNTHDESKYKNKYGNHLYQKNHVEKGDGKWSKTGSHPPSSSSKNPFPVKNSKNQHKQPTTSSHLKEGETTTDVKWVKYVETIGDFKPTKIESKEGIDKTINEIRVILNKMTKKNYETQRDKIIELVEYIEKSGGVAKDHDVGFLLYSGERENGVNGNIEKSGGVVKDHDVGFLLYSGERENGVNGNIEKSGGVVKDHDVGFLLYSGELPSVALQNIEKSGASMNILEEENNKTSTTKCYKNDKERERNGTDSKHDIVDPMHKIAQFIFDISSSNRFFTEIYATLYKELIDKYGDIYTNILNTFIHNFKESIQTFSYCDPNTNYEKYCEFTKEGDRKKAITTFIIMLLNRGVIPPLVVIELTEFFQTLIQQYIKEEGRTNEIDELGEILYILISLGNETIGSLNDVRWDNIIHQTCSFTTLKVKEQKSLSTRFIFKMKDLYDLL